jgi:hypothetical protein
MDIDRPNYIGRKAFEIVYRKTAKWVLTNSIGLVKGRGVLRKCEAWCKI